MFWAGALSHASLLACKAATVLLSFCVAGGALTSSFDWVPRLRVVSEAMVYVPTNIVTGHSSLLPEPDEAVVPILKNLTAAPQAAASLPESSYSASCSESVDKDHDSRPYHCSKRAHTYVDCMSTVGAEARPEMLFLITIWFLLLRRTRPYEDNIERCCSRRTCSSCQVMDV